MIRVVIRDQSKILIFNICVTGEASETRQNTFPIFDPRQRQAKGRGRQRRNDARTASSETGKTSGQQNSSFDDFCREIIREQKLTLFKKTKRRFMSRSNKGRIITYFILENKTLLSTIFIEK